MTTAEADSGSGGLTAEERLLRDTAREFAQREIAPTAIERDEQERFDRSIFDPDGRARADRRAAARSRSAAAASATSAGRW